LSRNKGFEAVVQQVRDRRYLIIAGILKGGTTSLFYYLRDHPGVCASTVKETRFFLEREYPVQSICRFEDGLHRYAEFFPRGTPDQLYMEATPFYLLGRTCAERIHESLPDVKLVFILRDPVDRLVSSFRYRKQYGLIPVTETFKSFVDEQFEDQADSVPYPPTPLMMGSYSGYLQPYLEAFDTDQIMVLHFEDLKRDPGGFVSEICRAVGLDESHFQGYEYGVHNPTRPMASPAADRLINALRYRLSPLTFRFPRIHQTLLSVKRGLEAGLSSKDSRSLPPPEIEPETLDRLQQFYGPEAEALQRITGKPVPWQLGADSAASPGAASSARRRRILYLTPQLPFPPRSGGTIKSWRVVEHLARRHDLSVFTFLKRDDAEYETGFRSAVKLRDYYSEPNTLERSPRNLLSSYLRGVPLTIFRNRSKSFAARVAPVLDDHDIVFVDHFLMYQYLPDTFKGLRVLHTHNAEFVMWSRFSEVADSTLKRLMVGLEAARIKRYERSICDDASVILATPNDIESLVGLGADREKFRLTYHLADDAGLSRPALEFDRTDLCLFFVGTLTWEANVDGLLWFIRECWEYLKQRLPGLRFVIAGGDPDARLQEAAAGLDDIELPGFVEDLELYYGRARVFVCPLRFGSGMKVKVIEAMYRGMPVVTTPVGAEGLSVDDRSMGVADTPAGLTDWAARLCSERDLWESFRDRSRELAGEHYSWERVFKEIDEVLSEA